ncbi:unnamed protein product [Urochloa decumbens]|uniref:KIB1-4 beta-propeller domain-containing protein n=1 Tax=Urochloa decumbens TaxID=240449 RepID=A0ABC9B2S3_9POAL
MGDGFVDLIKRNPAAWSRTTAMDSGADTLKRKRSRSSGRHGERWAGVPADILGAVLRLLPCFTDRSAARSACRHWRASAAGLPPPLPLLAAPALPKLRVSCLRPGGTLAAARLATTAPEGVPAAAGDVVVSYVGSSGAWLAGVASSRDAAAAAGGGECFLVNAFSHEVVRLPDPRTPEVVSNGRQPPCSLAAWDGAMACLRRRDDLRSRGDKSCLLPGRGKLYLLRRFAPRLYALQLEEDDDHGGVNVSRVEECVTEPLLPPHPVDRDDPWGCNLAVWRDKLLLIIRYYGSVLRPMRTVCQVRVLALDFGVNPCGLTEIRSLDGDCIFVDSYGCHSFPARLHDGVVEGDLIYFVNRYDNYSYGYFYPPYDAFVYNVRNGAMRPFAAELPPVPFVAPRDRFRFDLPLWLLPSE